MHPVASAQLVPIGIHAILGRILPLIRLMRAAGALNQGLQKEVSAYKLSILIVEELVKTINGFSAETTLRKDFL
jgi:hypothetical protein